MEQRPDVFAGGLALCGPLGSFQRQINYLGDFRVVFDRFFKGVLPGTAIDPDPDGVVSFHWDSYADAIEAALRSRPGRAAQLLRVMRVPHDPDDVDTIVEVVVDNLWYNVFGAPDAQGKLGGQPFDNTHRFYTGSSNDFGSIGAAGPRRGGGHSFPLCGRP